VPEIQTVAIIYALTIICVIAFQCCLIAGAPWGHLTQGGQHTGKLPTSSRALALLSILLLIFMGAAITSAAGLPPYLPEWCAFAAVGLQLLSAVLNWITPSSAERRLWGPITIVMSGLAGYVVFVAVFSSDQ